MINRRARDERRKVAQIIERAVQKSRAPGSPTFGGPVSSISGTVTTSPALGGATVPDADGNTIHGFMLGVDALAQTGARLRVQGEPNRYYG